MSFILFASGRSDNVTSSRILHLMIALLLANLLPVLSGCRLLTSRYAGPSKDGHQLAMSNPMVVPVTELDFTWGQIVDMVDDYFEIASEQQVREIGGVLMEGRIVTQPQTGANISEILKRDSTHGYERWHATMQSIRRSAHLRVIPVAEGLQVYVEVFKELEDVSQPEFATVASSVTRHDGSLVAFDRFNDERGPATLGWIPLGRDASLEQVMLRNLHARLYESVEVGH